MRPTRPNRAQREDRYARIADPIMIWLALIFLVVFTAIVAWQDMPAWLRVVCLVLQVVIWVAFVIDLVVRVTFAERPLRWLLTHPLDVLAVLWPAFRPLKVLAVIGDSRLRSGQAIARTSRAVIIAGVLLIWVCSVAVLAAERGQAGSTIENLGDAVWWAFVTIATVGYGDMVPVTAPGRAIGIVLMVVGLALVAIITASIASWFVANSRGGDVDGPTARDDKDRKRIIELERKLDRLLEANLKREDEEHPRG
ncbi:potassium channel family protein [Demequina sp.]|uniref:potassium channel family protein n=1 Tax=Demequina sp. TaxID=2050685 RepID=UPI003D0C51CF